MQRDHWYLTEALIFAHFAIYFVLAMSRPDAWLDLAVLPGTAFTQPWRLITFQFIQSGPFWLLISMYLLFIMARPLEEEWGSFRFLLFWLVSVLGASLTATMLGYPLAGDIFFEVSLLFTYATMYPDTEFLVFFILPVKVKWLALIGGGMLLVSSFTFGLVAGIANAAGMSAGYLFFLAFRRMPSRRKLAFELAKRKNRAIMAAEGAREEQRNRAWDPKVREAEARAREHGAVAGQDLPLLNELDAAVDKSITVCGPEDFRYTDDPVCRSCKGYAECAARRIRQAAEEHNGG